MIDYYKKYIKYKSKYLKLKTHKVLKGGLMVSVKDIIITKQIYDAIIKYAQKHLINTKLMNINSFDIDDSGSFMAPLNRLERMMGDFEESYVDEYGQISETRDEPVKLKKVGDHYTIMDGRHRVARAIILGESHINASIV